MIPDDCDDANQAAGWRLKRQREERRRSILMGGKVQVVFDETDCDPGGVDSLIHLLTGGHSDSEAMWGPDYIDMTTGKKWSPATDCDGPEADALFDLTVDMLVVAPARVPGLCPDCTTKTHCARYGLCWGAQ